MKGLLHRKSKHDSDIELTDEALAYFPIKDLKVLLAELGLDEVKKRLEESIPQAITSIAYLERLFRGSGFHPRLQLEHYEARHNARTDAEHHGKDGDNDLP